MNLQILFIVALSLAVTAIRVPVDGADDKSSVDVGEEVNDPASQDSVYYTSNEGHVDSYLVPPDPHKNEEILDTPDGGVQLASHLVPPPQDKQDFYYNPAPNNDKPVQSDWLPITNGPISNKPTPHVHEKSGVNKLDYQIVNNPVVVPPELLTTDRGKIVFQNPITEAPLRNQDSILVNKPTHPLPVPTRTLPKEHVRVPIPSRHLLPPSIGAVDEYSLSLPLKYDLPLLQPPVRLTPAPSAKIVFDPNLQKKVALNFEHSGKYPRIALDLIPPKSHYLQRIPTALYPKKYAPFHPVPIPIGPFVETPDAPVARPIGNSVNQGKKLVGKIHHGIPKGKPSKPFQPYTPHNLPVPDEDKIQLFQQQQEERNPQVTSSKVENLEKESSEENVTPEQVTSETNFGHPGRNHHQALVRPIGKSGAYAAGATPPGERTEFRMHGMKGPHSYQFGYDTGKGKNRQFRYEERDNDGHVRGHYGYMDKHGKLRVVNYDADPKLGFRAEAPTDAEEP